MTSIPGTFKGFDVLVMDPIKVFADSVVCFEMCQFDSIFAMIKNNASLDYASIVESTTRSLMVIMIDSPEARNEIQNVRKAAECAQDVKKDYDKEQEKKNNEE